MHTPKPDYLRATYDFSAVRKMNVLLSDLHLNTVCKEAGCPNISECYRRNTATFLIMGNNCTRRCRFCGVPKAAPTPLDPAEPEHVAEAAAQLGLRHVVVTSVTRDDLPDGGAAHFAATITAIRGALPQATVEVLIPDMGGEAASLDAVLAAAPDVLGHNVETVPALYGAVRPQADYRRSLGVLRHCRQASPEVVTKTGLMVGLGETEGEMLAVMDDLVAVGCDVLTIGQYLQPSKEHIEVREYVPLERYERYRLEGERRGIGFVASAPLVRSSYRAAEAIEAVRRKRR